MHTMNLDTAIFISCLGNMVQLKPVYQQRTGEARADTPASREVQQQEKDRGDAAVSLL